MGGIHAARRPTCGTDDEVWRKKENYMEIRWYMPPGEEGLKLKNKQTNNN